MFDHVTIRVTDRDASARFYNTVLPALGIPETRSGEHYPQWDDFSLSLAAEGEPVTRCLHVGFVAPSPADADAFWRVGTGAGYEDDGAPGPRPNTATITTEPSCSTPTGTASRQSTTDRYGREDGSTISGFGSPT